MGVHELSCAHTLLHAHVFDPHAGALGHVIVANTHVERVDTSPLPLRVQLRKDDAVVRVHLRASGHVSIKASGERTCAPEQAASVTQHHSGTYRAVGDPRLRRQRVGRVNDKLVGAGVERRRGLHLHCGRTGSVRITVICACCRGVAPPAPVPPPLHLPLCATYAPALLPNPSSVRPKHPIVSIVSIRGCSARWCVPSLMSVPPNRLAHTVNFVATLPSACASSS